MSRTKEIWSTLDQIPIDPPTPVAAAVAYGFRVYADWGDAVLVRNEEGGLSIIALDDETGRPYEALFPNTRISELHLTPAQVAELV